MLEADFEFPTTHFILGLDSLVDHLLETVFQGEHATSRQTRRAGKRKGRVALSWCALAPLPFDEKASPRLDQLHAWPWYASFFGVAALRFLVQVGWPFSAAGLQIICWNEMKNSLFGYGIGLQLSASKKGALFRNTSRSSILQHPNYRWWCFAQVSASVSVPRSAFEMPHD